MAIFPSKKAVDPSTTPAEAQVSDTKDIMRQHYNALLARKDEIEASSKTFRDQRQALHDEQNSLTIRIQALDQQINDLERPELITVMEDISKVARILGGRAMSDNVEAAPASGTVTV